MRRNPIVVGAVVILSVVVIGALIVLPRASEVGDLRARLAESEEALGLLEADVASLRAAQEDGLADEQLAAVRRSIPSTPDLPALFDDLLAAAADAGVVVSSIAPGAPTPSGAGSASAIPLSLSVSGDYFGLARFLYELESMERITLVKTISLSSDDSSLTMQVTAEVYTTDLSAGPGSDPAPGPEIGA